MSASKFTATNAGFSSLRRMVRALAVALATEYGGGWKAHAEHVGEMPGLTPADWAKCNWRAFKREAADVLRSNVRISNDAP